MTNLEKLKKSNIDEMAEFLCTIAECANCPANNLCYTEHNGMGEWLLKEFGADE